MTQAADTYQTPAQKRAKIAENASLLRTASPEKLR
jgi:hypothetical protein